MSDWTRGYPIERLRALALPFKTAHKPLVFGAFGLTKERDVAEALARGGFISHGAPTTTSVAIWRAAHRDSVQVDFSGKEFTIPKGAIFATEFVALEEDSGYKVINSLRSSIACDAYVEIFEEDLPTKALVLKSGASWIATKITAGGDIKGVYCWYRVGPITRDLEPEEAASLEILSPSFVSPDERDAVLAEAMRADELWAQHYSSYNKRKSWTSFSLRGYSDDPGFIIKPSEMAKSWKAANPDLVEAKVRWTPLSRSFPFTMSVVSRLGLGLEFDRVRFMRLRQQGGELTRHADITDREAGVQDGKVIRLHIPIRTNEWVRFIAWGHRGDRREISLPERSLCYLDQRKPHAVQNRSGVDRIHLVIDVRSNENLRSKIRESYVARSKKVA